MARLSIKMKFAPGTKVIGVYDMYTKERETNPMLPPNADMIEFVIEDFSVEHTVKNGKEKTNVSYLCPKRVTETTDIIFTENQLFLTEDKARRFAAKMEREFKANLKAKK